LTGSSTIRGPPPRRLLADDPLRAAAGGGERHLADEDLPGQRNGRIEPLALLFGSRTHPSVH